MDNESERVYASQPVKTWSSSAASSCGSEIMTQYNCWVIEGTWATDCAKIKEYNLRDLYIEMVGSDDDDVNYSDRIASDNKCCELLAKLCDEMPNQKMKIKKHSCIELLKDFGVPSILCTTDQRPDTCIHRVRSSSVEEKIPSAIVEVQNSSPYENTINKCIFVATDLLRLCRMYDTTISEYTAFAFPKLPEPGKRGSNKQCVVKVLVSWDDNHFHFLCRLTAIADVKKVKEVVREVISSWDFSASTMQPFVEKVFIRLSPLNLGKIGQQSIQLPSMKSIIVKSDTHVFKSPLLVNEQNRLSSVSTRMTLLKLTMTTEKSINHSIFPIDNVKVGKRYFYKYPFVCHDHLEYEEAKACLVDLVGCVHEALTELHTLLNLAHLDVRLENICFNEGCEVVLIDLDRSAEADDIDQFYCLSHDSCMYRPRPPRPMNASGLDWMQLGWMVAWILLDVNERREMDYHNREFDTQPQKIKQNDFLRSLIKEGTYPEGVVLENTFPQDCKCKLADVITRKWN